MVDERFLDVGAALARLGVPISDLLAEWEQLLEITTVVADRFVGVFERHLWPTAVAASDPTDTAAALLGQLGPLAERVVSLELEQNLLRRGERFAATAPGLVHINS